MTDCDCAPSTMTYVEAPVATLYEAGLIVVVKYPLELVVPIAAEAIDDTDG